jgi:hypothetical protein
MRGGLTRQGMRGGTRKKEEGLAESGRVLTSQSDPIGLSQAEAFRNSLADSVSFRFPSWLSLDGAPLLRRSCSALCQALRGGEDMTWSFDARSNGQPGYSLGESRRPIAVWISAGSCSRLARNRLLRMP